MNAVENERIQSIKEDLYSSLSIEDSSRAVHPNARRNKEQEFSQYFDHTLLKHDAGKNDFLRLCREAIEYNLCAVCLPPNRVQLANSVLQNSSVRLCTVIGFPLGYDASIDKARQCERVVKEGAEEIDMVISLSHLKEKDYRAVYDDIYGVVNAAGKCLVKVIIETRVLSWEEKVIASLLTLAAGADMLKTSTGFTEKGATVEDVALLRKLAGSKHGVKASGGIRSFNLASMCIEAGADRIGVSASISILQEKQRG